MKKLLAVLLFAVSFSVNAAWEGNRAEYIALVQKEFAEQVKKDSNNTVTIVVEDTGEDMDIGEGEAPVVIVKLLERGRECLVVLHPTDPSLVAVLGCVDGKSSMRL